MFCVKYIKILYSAEFTLLEKKVSQTLFLIEIVFWAFATLFLLVRCFCKNKVIQFWKILKIKTADFKINKIAVSLKDSVNKTQNIKYKVNNYNISWKWLYISKW